MEGLVVGNIRMDLWGPGLRGLLRVRCKVWAGMGAYLSTAAPGIPTILHGLMS